MKTKLGTNAFSKEISALKKEHGDDFVKYAEAFLKVVGPLKDSLKKQNRRLEMLHQQDTKDDDDA